MRLEELLYYRSLVVNDTDSNGGRASAVNVPSGEVGGFWPHVPRSERTTGSRKYRKEFFHVVNDADEPLVLPMFWLDMPTPGEDWAYFFPGNHIDVQSEINLACQKYGSAFLKNDVAIGAESLVVTVENEELASGNNFIFPPGPAIASGKLNAMAAPGNEEFVTIDSTTVSDLDITINLTAPLTNAYLASAYGRISSIYSPGTVQAAIGTLSKTSTAGIYDNTGNPILADAIGGIYETFTLTFDDNSGNFTCRKADGTSVGSGNTASLFAPINSDFAKPFFQIPALFWVSGWVDGDSLEIPTTPAKVPLWTCRRVPALCAPLPSNKISLIVDGEGNDE